jgi:hypothetical protein
MDFENLLRQLGSANDLLGNLIELWGSLVVIFHAAVFVWKRVHRATPATPSRTGATAVPRAQPVPRRRRHWLVGVASTGSLVTVLAVVVTYLYVSVNSARLTLNDVIGAIVLMVFVVLLGVTIGAIAAAWALISAVLARRWGWALGILVGVLPLIYLAVSLPLDDPLSLQSVPWLAVPIFLAGFLPGLPAFIYATWGPAPSRVAQPAPLAVPR